jgi:hypothetical protein
MRCDPARMVRGGFVLSLRRTSVRRAYGKGFIVKNWRDDLPVHPAADLFPLMSEAELRELADDIQKNEVTTPIVVCTPLSYHDFYETRRRGGRRVESLKRKQKREANLKTFKLLDGRNRLDAQCLLCEEDCPLPFGLNKDGELWLSDREYVTILYEVDDAKAYDLVLSYNVHRRHLTAEQKRELIAKLLRAKPDASDRQIAKQINSSPSTVGAVRKEKEASGDVSKLDTRTDTKGRKQPGTKPKKAVAKLADGSKVNIDDLGPKAQAAIAAQQGEITIEDRKVQMEALDQPEDCTAKALCESDETSVKADEALAAYKRAWLEHCLPHAQGMLANDFEHAQAHYENTNFSIHMERHAQEWMDAQIKKIKSRLHRKAAA